MWFQSNRSLETWTWRRNEEQKKADHTIEGRHRKEWKWNDHQRIGPRWPTRKSEQMHLMRRAINVSDELRRVVPIMQ